jgi:hypothetical protein
MIKGKEVRESIFSFITVKMLNHLMFIIMNITLKTGFVIKTNLSSFPGLKKATKAKVLNYKIIGHGTGIHWPFLDEDLSLKGFLKDELLRVVKPSSVIVD